MFKDQKRELQRLEEALEEDRALYEPELPEEFEEIPADDDLPEEFDEAVFSIRNTDRTDVDPEELSEELWEPEKPRSLRLLGFLTVLLLIAAVLGWLVLKERGLLP
jgi:hypothetical protein